MREKWGTISFIQNMYIYIYHIYISYIVDILHLEREVGNDKFHLVYIDCGRVGGDMFGMCLGKVNRSTLF